MADDATPVPPENTIFSSVSDMPVVSAEPEAPAGATPPPEEQTAAEAVAAEAVAAEGDAGEGDEAPPPDEGGETPQPVEAQPRREDPRTRRARELEAQVAEQKTQIDRLIAAIERVAPQQPQVPPEPVREAAPPPEPVRPVREAFDTPDAYDDALIEYAAAVTEARIESKRANHEQQNAQRQANERAEAARNLAAQTWQQRRTEFMAQHEDYSAIAESPDLQITHPMAQIISTHEKGPAIAYWLGQNPQEAERIAKVTGFVPNDAHANFQALMRAGLEIGRIESRLAPDAAAQPRPQVSRAPAPIRPITSTSANANPPDPDEMSGDEYADMRLPKLQAERQAGAGRLN